MPNTINPDTLPLSDRLLSTYKQYYEGAITYAEFIMWILTHLPAPCDNPENDTIYRCLYAGAFTALDLSLATFGEFKVNGLQPAKE